MAKDKAKPSNLVDPQQQQLFIVHRDKYAELKAKLDKANGTLRAYVKTIKGDGFKLQMIKDAIQLSTPEGEADFRAEMASRMLAAAYVGAAIGTQLTLFLDPDRTPAIDRAADEGRRAWQENKGHNPPYDASTPQHKAWSEAYYAEQERQATAGIKKLDGKKAAANAKGGKGSGKRGRPKGSGKKGPNADPPAGSERTLIPKAEKEAQQAKRNPPKDDAPPRKPAATPVTRATAAAQRNAARDEAESYFTKQEPQGNA